MSEDNVRQVREGFAALERGDVDFLVARVTDDFEFVNPDYAVEPGTRRGPDGYRIALNAMLEIFEYRSLELEEAIDLGERVVALGRSVQLARGSGVRIEMAVGAIFTFRDGKPVRLQWFQNHDEARAAAGIEAGSADGA